MGRMEELSTNPESANALLSTLLTGLLLGGGILAAYLLARQHRQNPPDVNRLTDQLAERAWSIPQVGLLLGSLLLLYFIASFSGLFFYEEQIPIARLAITVSMYALVTLLITFICHKRGGSLASECGLSRRQMKTLLLSPVFYLALIPFLLIITQSYHLILEYVFHQAIDLQDVAQIIMQDLSWLEISYMLTAIFLAPFYEELLFRGILFPFLIKRAGLIPAIVMISLIFAAMHFHLPSLAPLVLLSAALCLAYWRTGSLWVSIGMHVIFNAVSILALNLAG